jgi:hypothetical protein
VTEVPEHLLRRSRERREQLGAAIAADLNRLRRAIEHG